MPVVKYRTDKNKAGGNTWWSDKQKYEAVGAYLLIGNIMTVQRMTGIPEITLRKWKASPWWKEAEDEIRKASKLQLSGKLTKAIELSNLAIEDRLENGDFSFNPKTGQMVRKQISADTALKILSTLVDKQLVLDKAASEATTVTAESVTERLKKIADELKKFTSKKPLEEDIIDVEPISNSTSLGEETAGLSADSPGENENGFIVEEGTL